MSTLFRTEADVMVATAGRVDDVNNQVQGAAQVSFDSLMQRWNTSARDLQDALASISDNIRSNAKHFENVEADNAAAFNQVGGQGLAL